MTVLQLQMLLPNVTDLQISLFQEEDVDFIMKYMPQLEFLNNLPVERPPSQPCSKSTTPVVPDEFDEFVDSKVKIKSASLPMSEIT